MKQNKLAVLLVDDDPQIHFLFQKFLQKWCGVGSYDLINAQSPELAKEKINQHHVQMAFVDLHYHGEALGFELVKFLRQEQPLLPVIVISSVKTFESAQEALRVGASDYLPKGFSEPELYYAVEKALEKHKHLRMEIKNLESANTMLKRYKIIGNSGKIVKLREQIKLLAKSKVAVLLEAETGSGKELVARNLHLLGEKPAAPFVALDCASIPASMAEGILFGHEKGAFTGALQSKEGIFEQASG